jgi:Nuclease A inhibitor-like protein
MHPEELFDEFKVLVNGLPFNLPYHENGGVVYPFPWNSSVKGEFNIFNLFRDNDWVHLVDIDSTVKQWKGLGYARKFGNLSSRMVIEIGETREIAWQNTLQASGMLELAKFNRMYENREDFLDYYCHLSERKINDIFKRYAKITKMLKQELDNPIVYRISCGISDRIYILGQVQGMKGDKLGIYIKSNFVYNP